MSMTLCSEAALSQVSYEGTRTAQRHAAAEFGPRQARELAHGPQQWHVGIGIQSYGFAVKNE
jgi:hypothetical protein